jgi:hypothetical protein
MQDSEQPVARLSDQHLADLRRSGLSDETIAAAGIHSLSAAQIRELLKMDGGAGYAIPYPGAAYSDGSPYVRVRLDRPLAMGDGRSARYLTRRGESPRLYAPPILPEGWRENTKLRLLATEGEKKSLKATQDGYPSLGLGGTYGWLRRSKGGDSVPIADLGRIAWKARPVVVVGDSDLRANEQAAEGLQRFSKELARRGARTGLLLLPGDGVAKVGLDDFLVMHGAKALAELLATAGPGGRISTWADMAGVLGPVQWAWDRWLAVGFLTMIAAGLELGKSNLALRIAACYLRGDPWPDGSPFTNPLAKVLWCETEAGQAMNLDRAKRWRLPLDRIVTPFEDPLADVDLDDPDQRLAVADAAARDDVGYVVVDSLSGRSARDERGAAFGEVTGWLASVARDIGKPTSLTHHLRKRTPFDLDPKVEVTLEMVRGSTAVAQTCRTIWALSQPDPTSDWRRLTQIKNNLAPKPSQPIGMRITKTGEVEFGPAPEPPRTETATDRASDFLRGLLAKRPVPADTVFAEAKAAGLSIPTVNRAKSKLGIVSIKPEGVWHWSLPAHQESEG